MRHPVFMGLRPDKVATEVTQEPIAKKITSEAPTPRMKAKAAKSERPSHRAKSEVAQEGPNDRDVTIGGNTVHLTNVNKLYWPKEGITKGDVLRYYEQLHKVLLPHLKDRPQSLFRTPNGIAGPGFFQKDAGGSAPVWVPSIKIPSESRGGPIDYLLCNDTATLLYMVNLGCIELNPWSSRRQHLLKPDHIVLDLDPSGKNTFEQVVVAALAVKDVLDSIKVKGYCKTSGASGLHIYVPTGARYTYEQLAPFAKHIMLVVQSMLPRTTTLVRSLAKRDERKIYLDHLQNRKGQTIASVYSVRPKPGATVSTPLKWSEVSPGLDPRDFTIVTVPARVKKLRDLFKGMLEATSFNLQKAQTSINALLT
jgi:bifunctional non-homologous end joining protein LigD